MIINPHHNRALKIVILGSAKSGKSAVTVRYLTKRYIGEYSSSKGEVSKIDFVTPPDFLYHHSLNFDETKTEIEIMDTSSCKHSCSQSAQCLNDHISWGEAFVVVYSICDKRSFIHARYLLETISVLKGPRRYPIILLGNKRDLEHGRQVQVDEGQELSLRWQCQFYEVSAAESYVGVSLAFQSLIREARPLHALKTLPTIRRKTSPAMTVSKMIGIVFGKNGSKRNGKKRPSLSI
ncbi:ras-related and estrogen-regulated growth inhibitor-like protein [Dinothrombium tinctorium]|uniref:small monomeric GTPase n=1 Tax=Dinothrombium tinctorium TaxID=1965070 RepID=A0A443RAZ4_9ACAR|nr:ras-related and estrogen-regulated growth inhibitor-like protein [Dinothrombium tinctorium]